MTLVLTATVTMNGTMSRVACANGGSIQEGTLSVGPCVPTAGLKSKIKLGKQRNITGQCNIVVYSTNLHIEPS